jgi:heptosyltransferase-2
MIRLGRKWLQSAGLAEDRIQDGDWPGSLPGCALMPAADLGSNGPVWAIAPGTTFGEAKTWPVARLASFARQAVHQRGVRLVFLGDEAARGFTARLQEEVAGEWSDDPRSGAALVDLTGRTDLVTAVRILKAAQAFVGNDSGLMHLAAALGLPTVGVFGSSNPDWTAPLGARTRTVVAEGFPCRPCYRKTCNQEIFCLDTVSAATVLSTVVELVGDGRTAQGGV